jgi:FkbM family methyltransferase
MNTVVRKLKSSLRGTWIHHAVWEYKNSPPKVKGHVDGKQIAAEDRSANYDRQTVEVMFRVLRRNLNCIDGGAHVGDVLQRMVDISPEGRHYAFEPLPHLAQKLKERFPQVMVHQTAIGDRSGESEFQFVENDPAYSGLRRRIYYRPDPKITAIRVRVVTLDEVIPANEKIAFIKLDIEGGEYHAIKGGIETIRRCRPVIVFESGSHSIGQYGVKPDDVYSLVTETLGYELSTMERWLQRKSPCNRGEFQENWDHGPEFYFIASPKSKTHKSRWQGFRLRGPLSDGQVLH